MITKYSKDLISTLVKEKIAKPQSLRNYDIITDRQKGLSLGQLSIKYQLTRMQIIRIVNDNK
jgi:Mor family transcriptional regulator